MIRIDLDAEHMAYAVCTVLCLIYVVVLVATIIGKKVTQVDLSEWLDENGKRNPFWDI